MSLDASVISHAVRNEKLNELQRAGVSIEDFVDEYQTVWRYIIKAKRDHNSIPSNKVLKARFPDLDLPKVPDRDVPILLAQLRQRRKYIEFLQSLNRAADNARSYDDVDDVVQRLQADLNGLVTNGNNGRSHLVDLFSEGIAKEIVGEIKKRSSGRLAGIPTGLPRFDSLAGGMVPQKMIVVIGRTGVGKSWIDLLFVASAVMNGEKFILYPLEMTLFETAARLYTIFSQQMFGMEKVLRNYDITTGKVTKAKIVKLMNALEDKFAGQLYVADVSSLSDPYTNERIEAEVEMHKPSGFWVDYLTLMKAPGSDSEDWQAVGKLSKGIKNTAMRQGVVGGCSAQVNRSAMLQKVFLPRLEHISYGDSIGQDTDQAVSINASGGYLYYALVKNRGGPEFGKTKVRFDPNHGVFEEMGSEDEDDN